MDHLFFLHQVHDRKVFVLSGKGALPDRPVKADAVVTDRQGIGLVIQVADCQSVLLFDPIRRVIANVHSGWRGSVQNIIGATVDVMKSAFGCRPADIMTAIGPSLGPCCAEFINYRDEIPRSYWSYRVGDDHFDFWTVSRDQLLEAGLDLGHIDQSGICTKCRTDLFFAYRREGLPGDLPRSSH